MVITELFRMLRPPHPLDNGGSDSDASYRAQLYEVRVRDWRWRLNHTVLILVLFCAGVVWALSPIGLPMIGAIAWANGTDQKIQAAIDPLKAKVDEIAQQTKAIKEQQDSKEMADLRQKLFETRIAQCKARAEDGELNKTSKTRTNGDNPYSTKMRELQDLYFFKTHVYYVEPDCRDL